MKKSIQLLLLAIFLFGSQQLVKSQINFYSSSNTYDLVKIDSLLFFDNYFGRITNSNSFISIGSYFNTLNLNALTSAGNNTIFFAGEGGQILKITVPNALASSFVASSQLTRESVQFPYSNDLYDIEFISGKLFVSGSDGLIAVSSNSGQTWTKSTTNVYQSIEKIIKSNNANRLVAIGNSGLILFSTDGGFNWNIANSNTDRDINDAVLLDNGLGYAVGNNGVFLKTEDYGQNWSVVRNYGLTADLFTISIKDGYGFFGGEDGIMYNTINNGVNWVLNSSYSTSGHIYNVKQSSVNDNIIFQNWNVIINTFSFNSISDLLGNAAIRFWQEMNGTHTLPIQVTSDWMTCSWGNFDMRNFGNEPRLPYSNEISGSYDNREVVVRPWENSYYVIQQAIGIKELVKSMSYNDRTILLEFYANLLEGMAYARLAHTFDRAEIKPESSVSKSSANVVFSSNSKPSYIEKLEKGDLVEGKTIPSIKIPTSLTTAGLIGGNSQVQSINLQSYKDLLAKSLNSLSTAENKLNEVSSDILNGYIQDDVFSGFANNYTYSELMNLVKTVKAQTMVYSARNVEENEAINWDEIAELTKVGVDKDIFVEGDDNFWFSYPLMYNNISNWARIDQHIVHLMDNTSPKRYPDDTFTLPAITTDDQRIDIDYLYDGSAVPFRADRGYYFFSNYRWKKYEYHSFFTSAEGPMPFIHKAANDLLRAEALLRHSNPANRDYNLVAQLINRSRVTRGGLVELTGTETMEQMLDAIYYEWMIEVGPQGFGPESWFTNRRFGKLQPGTVEQLPVPAEILAENGLPNYTFGGETDPQSEQVIIVYPQVSAVGVPLKPTFTWKKHSKATSYSLLLNDAITGNTISEIGSITDTTFVFNSNILESFKNYSLSISALNGSDVLATSSKIFRSADFKMGAPILLSPSANSEIFPSQVTLLGLQEKGESQLANYRYGNRVQMSHSNTFTSIEKDTTVTFVSNVIQHSEFVISVTNLKPSSTYFWRAQTINEGGSSNWSEVRRFTSKSSGLGSGVLSLVSPATSQTKVSIPTRFVWTKDNDAQAYDLQVSELSDFSSFMQYSAIIDTVFNSNDLKGETRHFWRVRTSGGGNWTPTDVFTTGLPIPSIPKWNPDGGAEIDGTRINFKWATSKHASSYNIQISSSEDFADIVAEENGLGQNAFTWNSAPIGQYFWRVSASNEAGTSSWSEALNFNVVTTAINEISENLPTEFSLEQNFPNPFNPSTSIQFSLPIQSNIELSIYSMLGQKVATVFSGAKPAGIHSISFDASELSSGVYLYQLRAGEFVQTRKFTLLK